ncbi:MAG: hypothetical protein KJ970_15880 [Candidatus Eisenbacteria bacterium]|uniref:Uncharacterized protein n=1 Tax=Eiseniibacteriota bacterium TaxID=2212470 RepID=A0A948RWN6_UNCEI|nr:hypothetical protein [Candidatus Eisenbacteria bacterium]
MVHKAILKTDPGMLTIFLLYSLFSFVFIYTLFKFPKFVMSPVSGIIQDQVEKFSRKTLAAFDLIDEEERRIGARLRKQYTKSVCEKAVEILFNKYKDEICTSNGSRVSPEEAGPLKNANDQGNRFKFVLRELKYYRLLREMEDTVQEIKKAAPPRFDYKGEELERVAREIEKEIRRKKNWQEADIPVTIQSRDQNGTVYGRLSCFGTPGSWIVSFEKIAPTQGIGRRTDEAAPPDPVTTDLDAHRALENILSTYKDDFPFVGSYAGKNPTLSVFASCWDAKINPNNYITDIKVRISTVSDSEMAKFTPLSWAKDNAGNP